MGSGVHISYAELEKIWQRIGAKFSFTAGVPTFNSWIKPLQICAFEGGVVSLKAPSRFIKDWVISNFGDQLENYLREEFPSFIAMEIQIDSKRNFVTTESHIEAIESRADENKIVNTAYFESNLDNRFKFENFIAGESNNLAFTAAKKLARGDDIGANTLMIYGSVGCGKTHLLQAVAQYIRDNHTDKKALYLSAEKFMFQFVKAIREKDMVAFKEYLRSTDILLIDDIQFICGKANIQEEFIHTFNAIIENGGKVVLTANRAPSDFTDIDERIKSRLGWGLVADIRKADLNLRSEIIRSKAKLLNIELNEEVVNFLAQNINTTIRELEGALIKVVAQSRLLGSNITLDLTMDVLKDLLRGVRKELTLEEIKRIVCDRYSLKTSDIDSARRNRDIARPRQIAMYLAKNLTTKSLPEIGRNFGDKNHTTVIHAIKTIEKLKVTEPEIDNHIAELTRKLAS